MLKPAKYFIFDLDGTLAYTISDLTDAMNFMLSSLGFPEIDEDRALKGINNGSRKFVQRCLPPELSDDEKLVDRAFVIYSSYYSGHCTVKTFLYPGVADGIGYLKRSGARLAVFSNKDDRQTNEITGSLFPQGTFDVVLGYTGRFPHKPDPAGALFIAESLGAPAPACVTVVGDSDMDMLLARNAGMQPVGVGWGYRPASLLRSLGAELIIRNEEDFKLLI